MIELAALTKRYGARTAVDQLTFTVRPGRVTGFLGPNGAGKSTTMRLMLGLDHPSAGTVRVDGLRYDQLRDPLHTIGALLEAKGVHGGRTAYHHLLCLAQSNGIPERRVGEVLELVGLTEVARRRPRGFSLGMAQRLGIATALLGDPGILLLDEPVNGLDPEGIHWIRRLMRQLAAEGRTVFVSSHLMSEMALTADHLVVIGQGRLLADASMAEFTATHARVRVRVRSPERERLREVLAARGWSPAPGPNGAFEVAEATVEQVGEVAARHGVVLHELSAQGASLEEAFIRLTSQAVEYQARSAAGETAPPTGRGGTRPDTAPGPPHGPAAPGGAAWGERWRQRHRPRRGED